MVFWSDYTLPRIQRCLRIASIQELIVSLNPDRTQLNYIINSSSSYDLHPINMINYLSLL